jgi:beta-glucosidase-like glycosyl hydrolase/CubicO group peptidase (beta-lactamase class C family)
MTGPLRRLLLTALLPLSAGSCATHTARTAPASPIGARLSDADAAWVDATLRRLDLRHKVAQLVMPRVSGSFMTVGSAEYARVRYWVEDLGVGGLIETLGPPAEAALKLNMLQRLADIPLLISADMEEGPGQLMNGGVVLPYGLSNGGGTRFPPAMAIGATGDATLAREIGRITAIEARAIGVHMNFAPVVDVNNNPENPIINTRSYGADTELVSRMAAAALDGMQQAGLLATAKHFPGHGDTETDSHIDLPVIGVTMARADSVELPPYRAAIAGGVAGVMSAHIAFPALVGDSVPATLNAPILTGLLRDSLGFGGLIVTDALDMGAIIDGFGATEAAVLALEAGADLLLQMLPDEVGVAIDAIVAAVDSGRITEARIDRSVRRVLEAKATLRLHRERLVDIDRLPRVIGAPGHREIARRAAERSITVVRDRQTLLPIPDRRVLAIVYRPQNDLFAGRAFTAALLDAIADLRTITIDPGAGEDDLGRVRALADDADIVLFAPFVRVGAWAGPISVAPDASAVIGEIARAKPVMIVAFGSPYVIAEFAEASTFVLAWGPTDVMEVAAAAALTGRTRIDGRLPAPIPPLHGIGDGMTIDAATYAPTANPLARDARAPRELAAPGDAGMDVSLATRVDSLVEASIEDGAAPGAAVVIGRHGRIIHSMGYGRLDTDDNAAAVTDSTLWDLASLTKVVATTTAAMILVDDGRLDLDAPINRYLAEWSSEGDRARITVRNLLVHDSGLPAFAPLWRTARGRQAYLERIAAAPLVASPGERTEYSDFSAILLGLIIERISGQTLDAFVEQHVFAPLGMRETGFVPLTWRDAGGNGARDRIAPTELDTVFRMAHVRGIVHDENAFALGGVAGHAGLFSSARDLGAFAAMLLQGGLAGDTRIVEHETVAAFTSRQAETSSRALGWDTPSGQSSAGDWFSDRSFGHTGFTGTSIWVDPERDVFVVLLMNRVNPTRDNQRHARLRRELADLVQQSITDRPVARR